METTKKGPKSLQFYMRTIHRVLGYLTVGLVIVYALSGIILIHRTGDFMKKSTPVETTIQPNLDSNQLGQTLKIKGFKVEDETATTIFFTNGQYDKASGDVRYLKKEVVAPFNKMITLHKLADAKNPHIALFTTIFGVILFLLALTSLFMYKPSSKQFTANMIYTAVGVAAAVLLLVFA